MKSASYAEICNCIIHRLHEKVENELLSMKEDEKMIYNNTVPVGTYLTDTSASSAVCQAIGNKSK